MQVTQAEFRALRDLWRRLDEVEVALQFYGRVQGMVDAQAFKWILGHVLQLELSQGVVSVTPGQVGGVVSVAGAAWGSGECDARAGWGSGECGLCGLGVV